MGWHTQLLLYEADKSVQVPASFCIAKKKTPLLFYGS